MNAFCSAARQWPTAPKPSQLAWSALNIWPMVQAGAWPRRRNPLSPRELECLDLAFRGHDGARNRRHAWTCSERTVNFHLANAMTKLKVDNKMAAVQRACWFGLI